MTLQIASSNQRPKPTPTSLASSPLVLLQLLKQSSITAEYGSVQCLYCEHEAAPRKALCEACFAAHAAPLEDDEAPSPEQTFHPSELHNIRRVPAQLPRAAAFLLDALLLSLVADLIGIIAVGLFDVDSDLMTRVKASTLAYDPSTTLQHTAEFRIFAVFMIGANLIPATLYHLFFESFFAATPGKMVCGLRIESLGEESLSVIAVLKRFIVKGSAYIYYILIIPAISIGWMEMGWLSLVLAMLGVIVTIINLINPLLVMFHSERRGLHEMVSASRVIVHTEPTVARYTAWLLMVGLILAVRKILSGY